MKKKLSRKRITDTALMLLNRDGVDKFNMRKLARELGVDPMAVYYHHKNKAELLKAAMNQMMGEYEMPELTGDWRKDVVSICEGLRALARKHRGAFLYYDEFGEYISGEHRITEALYGVLRKAGFADDRVVWAKRVIWSYTEVFAYDEIYGWLDPDDKDELVESLADGDYPNLADLADHIVNFDPDGEFEFGLGVLLDGLEARMA